MVVVVSVADSDPHHAGFGHGNGDDIAVADGVDRRTAHEDFG